MEGEASTSHEVYDNEIPGAVECRKATAVYLNVTTIIGKIQNYLSIKFQKMQI